MVLKSRLRIVLLVGRRKEAWAVLHVQAAVYGNQYVA